MYDRESAAWGRRRDSPEHRELVERTADELAEVVAPPGPVADLGCGPGAHALALARRGYEVVGVDGSPRMVEVARARAARDGVDARFDVHDVGERTRPLEPGMAFVIEPAGPAGTPPATSPAAEATVERGRYLANSVANCTGCHTNRSMMDGSAIGPEFAGGMEMQDEADPAKVFVTPNLTPDPKTGRIAAWSEDQFVARFRAGKVYPGSHMPWAAFSRMSDADLRAIYRYLRSLPPVENETGPVLRDKQA